MPPISLDELPSPPNGKTGWPWTKAPEPIELEQYPSVTIAVPSYNQGEFLEQALRSILLQKYPNLTCHVMDGGSDDQSRAIIERYAPWLDYWQSQSDEGQCAVINTVLLEADTSLGGWMNVDDYYEPNGVARLARLKQEHPDNVVWCGGAREIDLEDQLVRNYPVKVGTVEQLAHWYTDYGFHQPASLFDLDLFQKLGGLDENLQCCLDVELWLRMRKHGSFESMRENICTVRNNPGAKAFRLARTQAVEMISVYHRMGLESARLRRLGEFRDQVQAETVRKLTDLAGSKEVLDQYGSGRLIAMLFRRVLSRLGLQRS